MSAVSKAIIAHPHDIIARRNAVREAATDLTDQELFDELAVVALNLADFYHVLLATAEKHPELVGQIDERLVEVAFQRLVVRELLK